MSIGIRLHDMAPGTLAQRAQAAHTQGFDCVQLALGKTLGLGYATPAACTSGLAAMVTGALAPLRVAVLGCYLHLTHPDEGAYQRTLSQYVAHLRMSRWLGGCPVGTETCNPNADNRFDPSVSHGEAALTLFIERLRPVVAAAETLGAIIAIEPVYTHTVSDARRARRVLDALGSPNVQIILDPVNLLHLDNLDRRHEVIAEALELLGADAVAVHLKDYVCEGNALRAVAVGQGEMDYAPVLRYLAHYKPHVPILLENTAPQNAAAACAWVRAELARYARDAGMAEGYGDNA